MLNEKREKKKPPPTGKGKKPKQPSSDEHQSSRRAKVARAQPHNPEDDYGRIAREEGWAQGSNHGGKNPKR